MKTIQPGDALLESESLRLTQAMLRCFDELSSSDREGKGKQGDGEADQRKSNVHNESSAPSGRPGRAVTSNHLEFLPVAQKCDSLPSWRSEFEPSPGAFIDTPLPC